MDRHIEKELIIWKSKAERLPLILRGARQVGKSYVVEKFGKENFKKTITINLELRQEFLECFNSLDPNDIIREIEGLTREEITPGETLLFIDEIQISPRAITSLRYFKEMMPDLHVIAAGSLLEFALQEESFSFPVGRVQFMYLKPLSFEEYLQAFGYHKLLLRLSEVSLDDPPSKPMHEQLLKLVREFFLVGGMPSVVKTFRHSQSFLDCENLQTAILDTYRSDFGKYASKSQYKYLQKLFEQAPKVVAQYFKFSKISTEIRSRELSIALDQLCWAGLVNRVHASSGTGVPLRFQMKENKFKILLLDVGLLQRANQVSSQEVFHQELTQVNQGVLAEQFVGQELLTYHTPYEDKRLFFWQREAKSSSAEIDYLVNINSEVVPIEVKAGATGRLRSLQLFMEEKKCPIGVRISEHPLLFEKNILSVPFYLIGQLPRLVEKAWIFFLKKNKISKKGEPHE